MKRRIAIVITIALVLALGTTAGIFYSGIAKASGDADTLAASSLADRQYDNLGVEERRAYAESLLPDADPGLTPKVISKEISADTKLSADTSYPETGSPAGDVRVDSGATLDLNGCTLTITGNLEVFGTLNIHGGKLIVKSGSVTICNGLLQMDSGSITVSGSFYAIGKDETGLLTGGSIDVTGGDFVQYALYSAKSFCPTGTTVSVPTGKIISIDSPEGSWLLWTSDLAGKTFNDSKSKFSYAFTGLSSDLTLSGNLLYIRGQIGSGRKLTVPGNTLVAGPLTLNGGELVANGKLLVDYGGGIIMNNDSDKLTATGGLESGGVSSLQRGNVVITGNFTQNSSHHDNSWVCGPLNKTKIITPSGSASKIEFGTPKTSCFGQLDLTGVTLAKGSTISLNYDLAADTTLSYTLATDASQPDVYYGGHLNGHNLTVPSNTFFAARQIVLGGGTLTVGTSADTTKTLTVSAVNGLLMTNASDKVVAYGDFIASGKMDAGSIAAGEIDIHGNFTQKDDAAAFISSGTNVVKFFGDNKTVTFNNPLTSWFGKVVLNTGASFSTLSTVSLRCDLEANASFNVHALYYGGNMGGHDLSVTGILHIAGSTNPGGALIKSTGAMVLDGTLTMANDSDRLEAGGDFSGDGTAALSRGQAEFKAGFHYSGTSYLASGSHKTTLSSGKANTVVIFDHPAQSYFADLTLAAGTTLHSSSKLSVKADGTKDLTFTVPTLYLQGNLNGKTVTLTGSLVVPAGTGVSLTVGGGTLNVSGAMTLDGEFVMTDAADRVTVGGAFTAEGPDETGLLTNGRLTLKGNFTQHNTVSDKSFVCSINHVTIFSGATTQVIVFDSPNPSTKSTFGTVYILGSISCDIGISNCSLKNTITSAYLNNIKGGITGGRLVPAFDPHTYNYIYVLPDGVDQTTISAYMLNETETVNDLPYEGNNPVDIATGTVPDGGTTITFTVKSAGGVVENTYTVKVEKLDKTLKSIDLDPDSLSLVGALDPDHPSTVALPAAVDSLTLTPTTNSPDSTFKFRVNGQDATGASDTVPVKPGETVYIYIIVTGQDGISTNTYTVQATRGVILTGFGESEGSELSIPFRAYTAAYTLTIPAPQDTVSITPAKAGDCTRLVIDGADRDTASFTLKVGESKPVQVTAYADSVSFTYTLTLKRSPIIYAFYEPSQQKTGMTLSPAFDAEGDKAGEVGSGPFTLTLPAAQAGVTIWPQQGPECSEVKINGGGSTLDVTDLKPGASRTLNIVATASYGGKTVTKNFTLIVTKAPVVTDLVPSSGTLTQKDHTDVHTFDKAVTEYYLDVPATGGAVYVTPTLATPTLTSETATVKVNGAAWDADDPVSVNPAPGATADITVVGTDTVGTATGTVTYTIHVVRQSPLTGISSTAALSPAFNARTGSYTASLPITTASITITPAKAAQCTELKINGTVQDSATVTLPLGGTAEVKIEATATDAYGSSVSTYTVFVERETLISDVTVSSGTFSKDFNGYSLSYNLYLSAGTSSVTLTPQKTSACKSFTINGNTVTRLTLTVPAGGKNTFKIYAVGNPTSYTQTIVITVYRIAPVTSLTLSTGKLSSAFSTSGGTYTVSVPASTTSVKITPAIGASCSEWAIDGVAGKTYVTLAPAIGTTKKTVITATAVNGAKYTWTITVSRAKMLSGITVSPTTYKLTPAFSVTTLNYTVDIPATVTSLKVTAARATGVYSMTINGRSTSYVTLTPPVGGSAKATIVLTSGDRKLKQTYTVTVRRAPLLTGITPTVGTISPAFNPATTSYTVTLPSDTTTTRLNFTRAATGVLSLKVNNTDVTYIDVPVSAPGGSSTATIVATATGGTVKATYTVVVKREPVLKGITVTGGKLNTAFSPATKSYTISVPATTSRVVLQPLGSHDCTEVSLNGVTTTAAESATASRSYYPPVGGSVTATISAKTAAGTTVTYTVKIVRAPLITGIRTSSTTYKISPAFSATTLNYTVNIPATTSYITIYATKASTGVKSMTINSKAVTSLVIKPPVGGSAKATIVATASDGKTKITYTVTVKRAPLLAGITTPDATLTPAFSGTTHSYTIYIPATQLSQSITVAGTSAAKTIKINNVVRKSITLSPAVGGSATATITVLATDGRTTDTYTVVVKRLAPLTGIGITGGDGATLDPAFNYLTTDYTVAVTGDESVTITPVKSTGGSFTINGATVDSLTIDKPLGGTDKVMITATDSSGHLTITYYVTITWS